MLHLVSGLTGSGKTAECLQSYRQALHAQARDGDMGQTLWITPTHRSVQQVIESLFDDNLRCCFDPGVMTFDQFAERVLTRSGHAASMLKPFQRWMLLRYLVNQSLQAGELHHFRNVARTFGFVSLLSQFISELKREETWPDALRSALERRPPAAKDEELCRLYERYQDTLGQWNKYDAEGRFWLARTLLAEGKWDAFPRLRLVVVDGFTDFTSTQYATLSLIARHADEMYVTFPVERNDNREDLFSKPLRSLHSLRRQAKKYGVDVEEHEVWPESPETDGMQSAGLVTIRQNLFANPRQLQPAADSTGVEMVAASGARAEMREVVRRVKSLLLHHVPAEDIIVTTRDLQHAAPLIEEIWSDAGVPFHLEVNRPVSSLPLAKSISALFAVSVTDWSYASLKKLLTQTTIRFHGDDVRTRITLRTLRRLNLRRNRTEILATLNALVSRGSSSSEVDVAGLETSLEVLTELDELLKPFQQKQTWTEHVQRLVARVRELFRQNKTDTEPTPFAILRPEDEFDLIVGLLRDASRFQDDLLAASGQLASLQEFASWVDEQFRTQQLPPRRPRPGEVQILEASDARHLRAKFLFVCGLQEGTFPSSREHQPFYSEQERQQWIELGVPLDHRAGHYQDEMQFFYRLATRPSQQLTLAYSFVSSRGQPQYASPFYQATRSLFSNTQVETRIDQLSPVPREGELLTETDLRLYAVKSIADGDPVLLRWMLTQQKYDRQSQGLLAAARMNAERFETHGFTPFEGMLQSPILRQRLMEWFTAEYTFSATQLESYATCPYRFHLDTVLDLEPQSAPRLETDHRKRGTIIHDLLAELHETELQELLAADAEGKSTLLSTKFLDLLQQRFGRNISSNELQQSLDEIEASLLSEWADLYQTQTEQYTGRFDVEWENPLEPRFREIAFGNSSSRKDTEEPAGYPPVAFGSEEDRVFIEGRIDRIDVGRTGGRDTFVLIDYKTGKPPKFKDADVARGTHLQLALYTVAIMRLQLLGEDAVPWFVGYWGIRQDGFEPRFLGGKRNPDPLGEEFLKIWAEQLDQILPKLIRSLRNAEFPVINPDEECTSRCAYSTICRVNQVRAVAEPLEKFWTVQSQPEENS